LWVSIRLGNATGADLSIDGLSTNALSVYSVHISRSSSEIISGITQKVGAATSVLISVVTVITSAALFTAIIMTLLAIDPMVAIIAAVSFGSAYGVIAWQNRQRLVRNSQRIAQEQTQVIKAYRKVSVPFVMFFWMEPRMFIAMYTVGYHAIAAGGRREYLHKSRPALRHGGIGHGADRCFGLGIKLPPGWRGSSFANTCNAGPWRATAASADAATLWQLVGVAGSKAALIDVLGLLDQPLPPEANQPEPVPTCTEGIHKFRQRSLSLWK